MSSSLENNLKKLSDKKLADSKLNVSYQLGFRTIAIKSHTKIKLQLVKDKFNLTYDELINELIKPLIENHKEKY